MPPTTLNSEEPINQHPNRAKKHRKTPLTCANTNPSPHHTLYTVQKSARKTAGAADTTVSAAPAALSPLKAKYKQPSR